MYKKKDLSVLYAIALTQFAMPFMFSGVGITLPSMGAELHAGGVMLGLVETVYLGATSVFLLPVGRLADLSDRNLLFKTGLLLFSILTVLLGFISSMPLFIFIRGLQGASASMVLSTNMAILASEVSPGKIGKAMGLAIGAVYAGLSAGPFVAGVITENLGWRWVYFVSFLPLITAYFVSTLALSGKWKKPEINFDWAGTITVMTAVSLVIFGSTLLRKNMSGFIVIACGIILFYIFYRIEVKVESPLIGVSLFRENRIFSAALLIQLLVYSGAFGLSFLFSLYLQTVKGFSPQAAGSILVVSPVTMAIFAPVFGRLSDRYSPGTIAGAGVVFTCISAFLASTITADTPVTIIYTVLVLNGFGFAMFSSPNMMIIMNSVERSVYSMASSLAAGMRTLGMVVSMIIITIILAVKMGDMHVTSATSGVFVSVMHVSFLSFSLLALISVGLSFRRARKPKA